MRHSTQKDLYRRIACPFCFILRYFSKKSNYIHIENHWILKKLVV